MSGQHGDLQQKNTCEDDDLTTIFHVSKERLELLVVRTIGRVIGPIMEDLVGKVVKEQIELVQDNLMHIIQCNLSTQGTTSEPRCLSLVFLENVGCPVLTSSKIEGEGGVPINLALVDSLTGEVVKTGPEAATKVEILVLKGEHAGHQGCNGKLEDFNNRIVTEMKGKKSILQGTTILNLKEGISSIDDLSFTQNSSWMRNSELCLGARAVNTFPGTTIEPAKTESFVLKDHRIESYAKKEIPSLHDKVWRLKHIGKGGARRKRLNDEKIITVKDLLVLLITNPERLQEILSVGSKTWEEITGHARTCIIDEAVYMYIDPNLQQISGVVFNIVGQLKGLLQESQYFPIYMISDDEQKDAQKLVMCAFDHWEEVSKYNDENALMERYPHTSESTMIESPCRFISRDLPLFNTCEQPGLSPYGICTSINCIGESSHLGSPEPGFCGPMYSPDSIYPHFGEYELDHFINDNNQLERLSPETGPKLTWTMVFCVSKLFMIRKRVGSLERDHVNKRLKIS